LGANLVRKLLAGGVRVRALFRSDARAIDGLDVTRIRADVRDEAALHEAFANADVVYHLAGLITIAPGGEAELQQTNIFGTRCVVAACRRAGVGRLVHFSSIHALVGHPGRIPVDEQSPLADLPRDVPYDRSKALAEREVAAGVADGLDAVVINPTGVIGPHDIKPSPMGSAMLAMYHRTIPMLVRGGFNWVDARDVAQTAVAAAERARSGERYIIAGHWATLTDISRTIAAVTGSPTLQWACPMGLARASAPAMRAYSRLTRRSTLYTAQSLRALRGHRAIRTDKAARELGHAPRSLHETIADTFAWYAKAGMLDSEGSGGAADAHSPDSQA
jgi:dihydroflavonol-4-reductase